MARLGTDLMVVPDAQDDQLVTAASEAAMNAVVHGGGGRGRVCVADDIGYSMKMMLDIGNRVYLLTGTGGTTVVMEHGRAEPPSAWLPPGKFRAPI